MKCFKSLIIMVCLCGGCVSRTISTSTPYCTEVPVKSGVRSYSNRDKKVVGRRTVWWWEKDFNVSEK